MDFRKQFFSKYKLQYGSYSLVGYSNTALCESMIIVNVCHILCFTMQIPYYMSVSLCIDH